VKFLSKGEELLLYADEKSCIPKLVIFMSSM